MISVTLPQLMIVLSILVTLALLRFGVPVLIMWLLNLACCRILHLSPVART